MAKEKFWPSRQKVERNPYNILVFNLFAKIIIDMAKKSLPPLSGRVSKQNSDRVKASLPPAKVSIFPKNKLSQLNEIAFVQSKTVVLPVRDATNGFRFSSFRMFLPSTLTDFYSHLKTV